MKYYYLGTEKIIDDMEIKIISFVVDRNVKLTIPPNRQLFLAEISHFLQLSIQGWISSLHAF